MNVNDHIKTVEGQKINILEVEGMGLQEFLQHKADTDPEFAAWIESVVGTKVEVTREAFKSFAEAVMAEVEQPATTKE